MLFRFQWQNNLQKYLVSNQAWQRVDSLKLSYFSQGEYSKTISWYLLYWNEMTNLLPERHSVFLVKKILGIHTFLLLTKPQNIIERHCFNTRTTAAVPCELIKQLKLTRTHTHTHTHTHTYTHTHTHTHQHRYTYTNNVFFYLPLLWSSAHQSRKLSLSFPAWPRSRWIFNLPHCASLQKTVSHSPKLHSLCTTFTVAAVLKGKYASSWCWREWAQKLSYNIKWWENTFMCDIRSVFWNIVNC